MSRRPRALNVSAGLEVSRSGVGARLDLLHIRCPGRDSAAGTRSLTPGPRCWDGSARTWHGAWSAQLVGEADEAVPGGQQVGNGGGDTPGRAPVGVVHMTDHDGATRGGGNGAADLFGGEGGPPVAVDGEADEALPQVGDDAYSDVVAIRGAGPEEARRDTQEPGELGLV